MASPQLCYRELPRLHCSRARQLVSLGGRIYSCTKSTKWCSSRALRQATPWQAGFSIFIFVLLSSEDGFSLEIKEDGRHPAIYNGLFTTIAFLVGGFTSVACGWLGMKIATYANARTALEARKGMAPAFMAGAPYAFAML